MKVESLWTKGWWTLELFSIKRILFYLKQLSFFVIFMCSLNLIICMCILMLHRGNLNGTIGSSQNKNCTDRKQIECYITKYLDRYTLSCNKVTLEQQYFILLWLICLGYLFKFYHYVFVDQRWLTRRVNKAKINGQAGKAVPRWPVLSA